MLNRRILRVKAMQGLYAYYNCRDANYNMAIDRIGEHFSSMLLEDSSLDKKELEKKKNLSVKSFKSVIQEKNHESISNSERDMDIIALEYFEKFLKESKKDLKHFSKNIVLEAEHIFDIYLWLLLLPGELAIHAEMDIREMVKMTHLAGRDDAEPATINLAVNKAIGKIVNDPGFLDLSGKNKLRWGNYKDIIHNWYKTLLKKDSEYLKYSALENPSFKDDQAFCLHLYKDILFKSNSFNEFLETEDIHWGEDKDVVKSMVLKTIKNLTEDNNEVELAVLSKNWADDKEFLRQIFEATALKDEEYDTIIAKKSENWDISRIAILDRIILKMAICEMINFPGIPIKVTINEYIELSKNFSTPKSRKFVNGILDVVSTELKESGIIRKSGRGLIDNQ